MRSRLLGIAALCFGLGCSLAGGEENAVPPPALPSMACTTMEGQLRACGLITAGALPCEGGDQALDCTFDCFQGATCAEMEELICEGIDDDRQPQGRLAACFIQCLDEPFRCDSGDTTFPGADCDGFTDCADGSDEAGCPSDSRFVCASGETFPSDFECDGFVDCQDGFSDEENCAEDPREAQRICNGMVVSR